ncbi:uncharacterized protein PHALS_12851 [Plasmopara halstedii]|uniref:Uncharacterized protein n=1 Tax=Plasmopara halstedii TaxID=4781 RepID=A0A0P1AN64_PLAHL|nr:uncharacterized protein PHALS_12851 [Plasmopara halstedii]CEG42589.1 hypothetical protein PHALS_12851 [Plasmopara halstedii]|eukprot:XP_024578958.1 hypothetical protein PHALS_12851 [Plasmopara halstedii]
MIDFDTLSYCTYDALAHPLQQDSRYGAGHSLLAHCLVFLGVSETDTVCVIKERHQGETSTSLEVGSLLMLHKAIENYKASSEIDLAAQQEARNILKRMTSLPDRYHVSISLTSKPFEALAV